MKGREVFKSAVRVMETVAREMMGTTPSLRLTKSAS